jgi:hypothetical protein
LSTPPDSIGGPEPRESTRQATPIQDAELSFSRIHPRGDDSDAGSHRSAETDLYGATDVEDNPKNQHPASHVNPSQPTPPLQPAQSTPPIVNGQVRHTWDNVQTKMDHLITAYVQNEVVYYEGNVPVAVDEKEPEVSRTPTDADAEEQKASIDAVEDVEQLGLDGAEDEAPELSNVVQEQNTSEDQDVPGDLNNSESQSTPEDPPFVEAQNNPDDPSRVEVQNAPENPQNVEDQTSSQDSVEMPISTLVVPEASESLEALSPSQGDDIDAEVKGTGIKPKTGGFAFPKFTDISVFEEYLGNPEPLKYEELYHRTDKMTSVLVDYQEEFDRINKEIAQWENPIKAQKLEEEQQEKEAKESRQKEEDEKMLDLAEKYEKELQFTRRNDWQDFINKYAADHPNDNGYIIGLLKNLRSKSTLIDIKKRQKARKGKHTNADGEEFIPIPQPVPSKKTKEDIEVEKRKRGRIMDPVIFEDMKQAAVAGFAHSKLDKHYGKQDPPDRYGYGKENDDENGRPKRNKMKRNYETDPSVSDESGGEEAAADLPPKRRRTQRKDDDFSSVGGIHTGPGTREGSPTRRFASGKRVGRPPGAPSKEKAKSKLSLVQAQSASISEESPEMQNGISQQNGDVDQGQKKARRGTGSQAPELGPVEEAQLHDAVESLVNQTNGEQPAPAPPVKKNRGGRPPKARPDPALMIKNEDGEEVVRVKNKGGRPPKGGPGKKKGRGGRVKKAVVKEEPTVEQENHVQLGEENDVLPSTEQDGGTSAPDTRPTTASSGATESTFGGRRTTRKRIATKKAETIEAEEPKKLGRGGKRKRLSNEDDTINVETPNESVAPPAPLIKRRKTRGKKEEDDYADEIAFDEAGPPETDIEAPIATIASSRPKRKHAAKAGDFIEVANPDDDFSEDEIDSEVPTRKKHRRGRGGARGGRRKKIDNLTPFKDESDGDDEEEHEGDDAARSPSSAKKRQISKAPGRGGRKNTGKGSRGKYNTKNSAHNLTGTIKQEAVESYDSSFAARGAPTNTIMSHDSGAGFGGRGAAGRSTNTAESYDSGAGGYGAPGPATNTNTATTPAFDPDYVNSAEEREYALMDPEEAEILRKRRRKSRKLAEATRRRWAEGKMAGPMVKRGETNKAKKLAKIEAAEKAKVDDTVSATGGLQKAPKEKAERKRKIAKSEDNSNLVGLPSWAAASKRSGRQVKPTKRALGYDGAEDEDEEEEEEEEEGEDGFSNEYERFQALSSPKGPVLLGKRARKTLFDLSQVDDEDSDY